jgi:hypothetical protein
MAGTGVMMFFKFDNGLMAPIHRLFSWVFLLGAINHIAANIRPFANHLKSAIGRASVVVLADVLLGSFRSQIRSKKTACLECDHLPHRLADGLAADRQLSKARTRDQYDLRHHCGSDRHRHE